MDEQLKPCPFCGNVPELYKYNFHNSGFYEVVCRSEGCLLVAIAQGEMAEETITKWNARPIEDALRAELDDLRRKWEGVPWDEIADAFYYAKEYEHHHYMASEWDTDEPLVERLNRGNAWLNTNSPTEPTK